MVEYDPNPREGGPALVTSGPAAAPAILVLDPAGAAKHFDVPATWHGLLSQRQVAWCRMPADNSVGGVDQRLDSLAADGITVDVLTSGPLAELGMVLVRRWAAAVRSLLLVDPAAPDERFPTEDAVVADRAWEDRAREQMSDLADVGVTVRVIAHSTADHSDRIPPPLPLGHPDVVEAVRAVVADLDSGS